MVIVNPISLLKKKKTAPAEVSSLSPEEKANLNKPATTPKFDIPNPAENKPQVFKDEKGRLSGVTIGGKTYLGLNPKDVNKMVEDYNQETTIPQGAISVQEAASMQARREAINSIQQMTPATENLNTQKEGFLSSESAGKVAMGKAITEGTLALGASSVPAVAAAPFTAGVSLLGIPIAVTAAVLHGYITGYTGKMKEERKENIEVQYITLQRSSKNLRMLINDVNTGGDPYEAISLFQTEMDALNKANSRLHLETQDDLNKFLNVEARVELAKFEDFNTFLRPQFERDFYQAILNPNPAKVILDPSDLTAISELPAE